MMRCKCRQEGREVKGGKQVIHLLALDLTLPMIKR